jgi:hypothetical protein
MTQLLILLSVWGTPIVSGIISIGLIYLIMVLGGRFVKNSISQSIGKIIIGLGYIFMVVGIISIIGIIINK